MKNTKIKFLIFAILAVLVLIFIFSNSMKTGEESNSVSTGVMETILKIIDPQGRLNRYYFHIFVRKAAHFTEFFTFGVFLCGMALSVLDETHRLYAALTLFVALFAAVIDEFIQSFTSRTSSARDVLLDFFGALTGVLITLLIGKLRRKKRTVKSE